MNERGYIFLLMELKIYLQVQKPAFFSKTRRPYKLVWQWLIEDIRHFSWGDSGAYTPIFNLAYLPI